MGNVKLGGGSKELGYTYKLDIDEALRKAEQMKIKMREVNAEAIKMNAGGGSSPQTNISKSNFAFIDIIRQQRLSLEALKRQEQELLNQQAALGVTTAELTRKFNENRLAQQELRIENQLLKNSQVAANGSYKEATQQLAALGRSIKEAEGGFKATNPAIRQQINEYNALNDKLKAFDAQLGNHQRNVGNYNNLMRGSVGVSQEFNRIIQDAPFGMMGVGNNIQQLTANYQQYAVSVRAAMAEQGKSVTTTQLLKGAISGILNPVNLLSLGISLVTSAWTFYTMWSQKAEKANKDNEKSVEDLTDRLDKYKKTLDDVSQAQITGNENSRKDINNLNTLRGIIEDESVARGTRLKAVKELRKEFPAYFQDLKDEQLLTAKAGEDYKILTQQILAAGAARAFADRIGENDRDRVLLQAKINENQEKGVANTLKIQKLNKELEGMSQTMRNNSERDVQLEEKKAEIIKEQIGLRDEQLKDLGDLEKIVKSDVLLTTALEESTKRRLANTKEVVKENTKDVKARESLEKKRDEIQSKINETIKKSTISQLAADQEEIESAKLKYAILLEEAIAFNAKKNKTEKGRKTKDVDTSGIPIALNKEIVAIEYKYETDAQIKEYEKQKQLFANFENYKSLFGKQAAIQRFGDLSNLNKEMIDKLTKENEAFLAKGLLVGLTEDEKKRFEQKAQLLGEAKDYELRTFEEIYRASITMEQKRAAIIEQYDNDAIALRAKGLEKQAKYAEYQKEQELDAFDSAAIKQLEGYTLLFEGFVEMSNKQTQVYLDNAKKKAEVDLASGDITKKTYQEIINAINNAQNAVNNRMPEQLQKASNIFKELSANADIFGSSISGVLGSLSDMLGAIGQVHKGVADAKTAIGNFQATKKEAGGGFLGSVTGVLSIAGPIGSAIGAITGIAKSVINFFKASKESAKKAQQEIATYNDNILKGELSYNQLLRERERTLKDISKLSVAELKTQQELLKSQKSQAEQDYEKLLSRVRSSGQQVTGMETYKTGGFLGIGKTTKTRELTSGLAGLSYEQIEQLATAGKLTAATKDWFEQLKKAKEELKTIGISMEDVLANTNRIVTGTTADAIASGILNGFKAGKRYAADFKEDFKGLMADALLSEFKDTYLDKAIEEFYKKFALAAADGLSDAELGILEAEYAAVIAGGSGLADALAKLNGKIKIDDSDLIALRTNIAKTALESQDLYKEIGDSFTLSIKENFLKTLESGDYADKVAAYHERFNELAKKGFTAADIASLNAEFNALAELAKIKIDEYEKATGKKITVKIQDPELEEFGTSYFPNSMSVDTNCPHFTN